MTSQLIKALALGSTCAACGAGRKTKNLRYDQDTFMPYCDKPHICNDDHPNSNLNIIKRGALVELVSSEVIKAKYQEHLLSQHVNSGSAAKIHRLMVKPTTIRIMDSSMAEYLIGLQESKELASLAETIRYCIEVMMENNGQFIKEHREVKEQHVKVEAAKEAVKELEDTTPLVVSEVPSNGGGWTF